MVLNYDTITEAISRVIQERLKKAKSKESVRLYLEHLKKDVWKNSPAILKFIDERIAELEKYCTS